MKKLREWFLLDLWIKLFIRHMRYRRVKREVYRCLKYKTKYEVSKQIAKKFKEEFVKQYPDSPLNKYKRGSKHDDT